MKRSLVLVAVLAILVSAFACQQQAAGAKKVNPGAPKLEFYVMSQCPYGVQVVNAIKDVADKLGPDLDLSIDFIGNKDASGNLTSMHGDKEVKGDIVQLCAIKYAPVKYLDMIACQNKNFREVDTNWEKCAEEAKLPVAQIKSCFNGDEGKKLLQASFDKASAAKASGSPTIFLNGNPYNGRRATTDFFRSICAEYKDKKPAACASIPEPPKVNITLIGDKRCTDCNTDRYAQMLKFRVANPVLKEVDYSDPDGKKLYDEIKADVLPIILFDATLDADKEASQMFARNLKPMGSYKGIVVGDWNPVCTGPDGCSLPACKEKIVCRAEVPKKLDLFVMSQCPYGVKALNAMEEVLKNFGSNISFNVNFIANGNAKEGFKALHGQPEVDENIRELCAIKHFGKGNKYMEYIICRNKDIRGTDWEKCAVGGIEARKIKACFEGDEGKKLLEENIKIGNALGIGASPTWLANNKFKFSGIDAETVRKNICDHNAGLKGCDAKLSGDSGAPVKGGCGQ